MTNEKWQMAVRCLDFRHLFVENEERHRSIGNHGHPSRRTQPFTFLLHQEDRDTAKMSTPFSSATATIWAVRTRALVISSPVSVACMPTSRDRLPFLAPSRLCGEGKPGSFHCQDAKNRQVSGPQAVVGTLFVPFWCGIEVPGVPKVLLDDFFVDLYAESGPFGHGCKPVF